LIIAFAGKGSIETREHDPLLAGTARSDVDCQDRLSVALRGCKLPEENMTERADLIRQANELRSQAEHETDENIRDRLNRMADHYVHLAESQNWTEAHPPDAAALAELFMKPD